MVKIYFRGHIQVQYCIIAPKLKLAQFWLIRQPAQRSSAKRLSDISCFVPKF